MAFPHKSGVLAGSERIALYDETGGNAYITAQQIANLVGVSGDNGLFSALNFWDDTVDGSLQPTKGYIEGGRTFLRNAQNFTIYGHLFDSGVVEYQPASPGSVQFLGVSSLFATTPNNSQLLFFEDGFNLLLPDETDTGPGTIFQVASAFHPQAVQLRSYPVDGENAFTLGNFATATRGFAVTGTSTLIEAPANNYFIGKAGAAPSTDNTVAEVIGRKADGQLVMRTVDSITSASLPIGEANQTVTSSPRTVTGNLGTETVVFQNLGAFSVSADTLSLGAVAGDFNLISVGNAIRFTSTAGSYFFGAGGVDTPPLASNIDNYLVLDTNTGQVGYRALPSSTDTNFANTDLVFGGNRSHNANTNSFSITAASSFTFETSGATGGDLYLTSTEARLTHVGSGDRLADYRLGTGTGGDLATVMPTDPGNTYAFLKYDETNGRLYQETVVLAADGNGIFDIANDTLASPLNSWSYTNANYGVTAAGGALVYAHGGGNMIFTLAPDRAEFLNNSVSEPTARFGSTVSTSNASIELTTSGAPAWRITNNRVDASNSNFQVSAGADVILDLDDDAPNGSVAVSSAGELQLGQYNGTLVEATPTSLLGVDGTGKVVPVANADYENQPTTPEWRQTTGTGIAVIGATQLLVLTADAGNGTVFTDNAGNIDVNSATFADVSVSLQIAPGAGSLPANLSVELYDAGNLAIIDSVSLSKSTVQDGYFAFRWMGSLAGTETLGIRLSNAVAGLTVNHVNLNVRD